MNSPYEIDFLNEQNNNRIARHVNEYRTPRQEEIEQERAIGSGLVFRTRLAITAAFSLFFGGKGLGLRI